MMLGSLRLTALVLASLAPVAFAAPVTLSINPVGDTHVRQNDANTNYGSQGALAISATSSSKGGFESVIKFDLAAINASLDAAFGFDDWIVDSVTLRLNATSGGNPIFNANVAGSFEVEWMLSDAWNSDGAGGVTWNTLPGFTGAGDQSLGFFNYSGANSGQSTYTLGLTSGLLQDIRGGSQLSLHLLPGDSSVSYLFNALNFGTASARPLLSVTASVPEPGSMALLGIAGVALIRRRR